ncbi:uncharacterized protein LOC116659723 [Camelus ferus]|uniref:Uncharacterized protein LOC116659723 n=1 Tax=Camelus ferus TaxID=419612 RepID=A0A8B8S128_CAMFR|nr:uncharacterized protein LOC116659723 [Camelus ferus]
MLPLPLPLLRLRAPPPPPPPPPSARLRRPGSRRRRRSRSRRSGPPGPGARRGRGAWPSCARLGGAPPRHVGPGECASTPAPARVTCTGAAATWSGLSCSAHLTPFTCQRPALLERLDARALPALLFICSFVPFIPPLTFHLFSSTCPPPTVAAPLPHFPQFNCKTGLGAVTQKVELRSLVTPKKWSGSALDETLVGFLKHH